MFKGELGTVYEIEHNYSLKELDMYRNVRIERKKREQEAEAERQRQLKRKNK